MKFAIFLFIACMIEVAHAGKNCDVVKEWLDLRHVDVWKLASQAEKVQLDAKRIYAAKAASTTIFNLYINGQLPKDYFEKCIPIEDDLSSLAPILSGVFWNLSLDNLKSSEIPELVDLVDSIQALIRNFGSFKFEVIINHLLKTSHSFGYHRQTNLIFVNLNRVNAGQWYTILIHQFVHLLDPLLEQHSETWIDDIQKKEITNIYQQPNRKFSELSEKDRRLIWGILYDGLNRTLLAKVRAWAFSSSIYFSGVEKKTLG